jgi:hypothetical protein
MRNIKIITVAFFIGLLCLNSDCNKVEETPPVNEFFILEGKLVNSCTDKTPKKNWNFICFENNNPNQIDVKTDSNGFFKIYSKFKGKEIILKEDGGKILLYKIPGGKSFNFGEIAYNFTIPVNLIYKSYLKITNKYSLVINYNGGPKSSDLFIKGPFSNEKIGEIIVNETPLFINNGQTTGNVVLSINYFGNLSQTKHYIVTTCGVAQDLIFE